LIIPFYINILLRFLVSISSSIIYIKEYDTDEASEDDDSDKTPTNARSPEDDGGETPTEQVNDISSMKNIKNIIKDLKKNNVSNRLDQGLPVSAKNRENLSDIKEEFSSYFDEDSGNNTVEEALDQIDDYIEGELSSLSSKTPGFLELSKELNKIDEDSRETKRRKIKHDSSENDDLPKNNESIKDQESLNKSLKEKSSSSENKTDPLEDLPTEMPNYMDDID